MGAVCALGYQSGGISRPATATMCVGSPVMLLNEQDGPAKLKLPEPKSVLPAAKAAVAKVAAAVAATGPLQAAIASGGHAGHSAASSGLPPEAVAGGMAMASAAALAAWQKENK